MVVTQDVLERIRDLALLAVAEAEKITMRYYSESFALEGIEKEVDDVTSKHYKNPATIADQESEKAMKKIILEAFPAHGFVGEEYGTENKEASVRWIVDPIDGTKSFMRGMENRAILLAVQIDGEIVLGVSSMPVVGETVVAWKGGGCRLNGDRCVMSERPLADAFIAHERAKFFHKAGCMEQLELFRTQVAHYYANKTPRLFHYLVQGKIEAIIAPPGMPLYDWAPYSILVQEAGGMLTDWTGGCLREDYVSAVASNRVVYDGIMESFSV